MKDQNLYCEALKLYPSSAQEHKVCKHMTLHCTSFLFFPTCVCTSSAPSVGAGMRQQLFVFRFCRSLLFLCCLRCSSEITTGMTWHWPCEWVIERVAVISLIAWPVEHMGVWLLLPYLVMCWRTLITTEILFFLSWPLWCQLSVWHLKGVWGHFVKLFYWVLESLGYL